MPEIVLFIILTIPQVNGHFTPQSLIEKTSIEGTKEQTFYLKPSLLIDRNHFVFNNSEDAQVLVFNRSGAFKVKVGKKGEGPGEFTVTDDVAWGPEGNLWIWDASRDVVQIFDQNTFQYLRRIILNPQNANEMIIFDRRIFTVGSLTHKNKQYIGGIFDSKGKIIRPFGRMDEYPEPANYVWKAGISEAGILATADISARLIRVFDKRGKEKKPISLRSPMLVFFEPPKQTPRTMADLRKVVKRFKTERHTRVESIFVIGSTVYVCFMRHNFEEGTPDYFLTIYKLSGEVVEPGVNLPGELSEVTRDRLIIFSFEETEYGKLEIASYANPYG
jgi:hypothetical protein